MNEKTFCVLPFIGLFVDTSKGENNAIISPCCVSSKYLKMKDNDTDLIGNYNHHQFKELRKNLLEGKFDKTCSNCWKRENQGSESIRQIVNNTFNEKLKNLNELIKKIELNNYNVEEIFSVDFFPSTYCNYRCRMCDAGASSSWSKTLGQTVHKPNYDLNEKIILNLIQNNKILKLNLTGGETVLQKQVHQLVSIILKNNLSDNLINTDLELVTNCSVFPYTLLDNFSKIFNKVNITLSLDGIGKINENQRKDSQWEIVEKNAKRYLDLRNEKFSIVVNCVVTMLNVNDIDKLIEWCFRHNQPDIFFTPVHDKSNNKDLRIELIPLNKESILEKTKKIKENLDSIVGNNYNTFDKSTFLETVERFEQIIAAHIYIPNNENYKKILEWQDNLFSEQTKK